MSIRVASVDRIPRLTESKAFLAMTRFIEVSQTRSSAILPPVLIWGRRCTDMVVFFVSLTNNASRTIFVAVLVRDSKRTVVSVVLADFMRLSDIALDKMNLL